MRAGETREERAAAETRRRLNYAPFVLVVPTELCLVPPLGANGRRMSPDLPGAGMWRRQPRWGDVQSKAPQELRQALRDFRRQFPDAAAAREGRYALAWVGSCTECSDTICRHGARTASGIISEIVIIDPRADRPLVPGSDVARQPGWTPGQIPVGTWSEYRRRRHVAQQMDHRRRVAGDVPAGEGIGALLVSAIGQLHGVEGILDEVAHVESVRPLAEQAKAETRAAREKVAAATAKYKRRPIEGAHS